MPRAATNSDVFNAIAEPRRRQIVELLARGGTLAVGAIVLATGMPQPAVHSQLASAVDAVVHVSRGASGARRMSEIAVLTRSDSGLVSASPAVTFTPEGGTTEHPAAQLLLRRLHR